MLDDHVAACKFTPVPCPNQCKEKGKITLRMRRYLDHHICRECPNRDYECEYCGEKDTYANITKIHDSICEKKKLPCTNTECTESIERGKMKCHLDDCDYTIIPCKYKNIRCDVELKRKEMITHEEDDKVHLHLALATVVKLQDTLTAGKPLIFKITEYQKKKDNNERTESPSFYTSLEGYHMCLQVNANGIGSGKQTHVSVYVLTLKGKHDNTLKWPFTGTYCIEVLNQLDDKNHHTRTANITSELKVRVGSSKGYHKFISHSKLYHDPSNNTQYLKEDTLYFRLTVIPSDHRPWLDQYY